MEKTRARKAEDTDEDDFEEDISVSGVPLIVWAVRMCLFLLLQGGIVLAAFAYYGFSSDPQSFGPGFRLDPIHASINALWGFVGSAIGFFLPRFSIDFALAFAMFFTAFAAFGTFSADQLGLLLGFGDNVLNWSLAIIAWTVSIYALCQDALHSDAAE